MSRTNRLLTLMQLFREYRYSISAELLAEKLEVSVRTIYRDIATLREQGVEIIGEAGIGYIVKENFVLPPMMLTSQEIEALILGSHWVKNYADDELASSAKQAIAKIKNVLPKTYQTELENTTLFVPQFNNCEKPNKTSTKFAPQIRKAIRRQRQCTIQYQDEKSETSIRKIYPFGLAFFDFCLFSIHYLLHPIPVSKSG